MLRKLLLTTLITNTLAINAVTVVFNNQTNSQLSLHDKHTLITLIDDTNSLNKCTILKEAEKLVGKQLEVKKIIGKNISEFLYYLEIPTCKNKNDVIVLQLQEEDFSLN